MKKTMTALALLPLLAATPVLAQDATGDAAAGADVFKKCAPCHSIVDPDGKILAGHGGKVGPNLYGMAGRLAGTYPDFSYGDAMKALGATGFKWNLTDFLAYVKSPSEFLQAKESNPAAKGKMMFKLASDKDAQDVWAYILSLSLPPAP